MACLLKQSTAVDIGMGPFLDSTDGNTVEGGLTITQPDIRLKKNGGNWAQKNAAQTLTHEENGWYEVALDTTDTDTLGILLVAIHESGALAVWREFMVVPANVYDSLVSTDNLQVDVTQWLGTACSTPTTAGVPEVDLILWLGSAVDALVSGLVSAQATQAGTQAKSDLSIYRKNVAVAKYGFKMVDATDLKTAETGLTVTCQRSLDGAAFINCATATATEIASGWYYVPLAAADLNADLVILRFTAVGAHPHEATVYTTP